MSPQEPAQQAARVIGVLLQKASQRGTRPVPQFGLLGIGHGYYGAFPIEIAAFGDAGVAWNQGESPTLFGGSRPGVASAGLAARINLFGFAVAQVDWVHPFDRPQRNWLWQFTLQPGF